MDYYERQEERNMELVETWVMALFWAAVLAFCGGCWYGLYKLTIYLWGLL